MARIFIFCIHCYYRFSPDRSSASQGVMSESNNVKKNGKESTVILFLRFFSCRIQNRTASTRYCIILDSRPLLCCTWSRTRKALGIHGTRCLLICLVKNNRSVSDLIIEDIIAVIEANFTGAKKKPEFFLVFVLRPCRPRGDKGLGTRMVGKGHDNNFLA